MTWYWLGENSGAIYDHTNRVAVAHGTPVVVIDPEDRESVERLGALMRASGCRWSTDVQTALREYANPTPPKPEEPTGLGAVVEAGDGRRWCRDFAGQPGLSAWYCRVLGARRKWSDLDVAEVLSPGVTE